MSVCVFTGFIDEDLVLDEEDNVSVIEFTMVCYEYRKSKATGEKTRIATYVRCEAWHTGADTIHKLGKRGSKLTVYTTARNVNDSTTDVIFRINKFDFLDSGR